MVTWTRGIGSPVVRRQRSTIAQRSASFLARARTSGAKALIFCEPIGTAEAVPYPNLSSKPAQCWYQTRSVRRRIYRWLRADSSLGQFVTRKEEAQLETRCLIRVGAVNRVVLNVTGPLLADGALFGGGRVGG